MLTERQIKADLTKARNYASELEEEADRLTKLANNSFDGVLDELRVAWKGENAEKYIRKGELLKSDITKTAKTLKSIASTIRSNAQSTYNAEMENLRVYQAKQKELAEKAAMAAENIAQTVTSAISSGGGRKDNSGYQGYTAGGGGYSSEGGGGGAFGDGGSRIGSSGAGYSSGGGRKG